MKASYQFSKFTLEDQHSESDSPNDECQERLELDKIECSGDPGTCGQKDLDVNVSLVSNSSFDAYMLRILSLSVTGIR